MACGCSKRSSKRGRAVRISGDNTTGGQRSTHPSDPPPHCGAFSNSITCGRWSARDSRWTRPIAQCSTWTRRWLASRFAFHVGHVDPAGLRNRSVEVPALRRRDADHQLHRISVIERILRHCGLWEGPLRTLASARGRPGRPSQVPEPRCDLELVLEPEFLAAEAIPSETHRSRELQLVLDPEFL